MGEQQFLNHVTKVVPFCSDPKSRYTKSFCMLLPSNQVDVGPNNLNNTAVKLVFLWLDYNDATLTNT